MSSEEARVFPGGNTPRASRNKDTYSAAASAPSVRTSGGEGPRTGRHIRLKDLLQRRGERFGGRLGPACAKGTLVSQTQPRRIAAARSAPGAAGGSRPCPRTAVGLRRGRSTPTRATARRSGALTLVPLPGQFLDRARQSRLEVEQLR